MDDAHQHGIGSSDPSGETLRRVYRDLFTPAQILDSAKKRAPLRSGRRSSRKPSFRLRGDWAIPPEKVFDRELSWLATNHRKPTSCRLFSAESKGGKSQFQIIGKFGCKTHRDPEEIATEERALRELEARALTLIRNSTAEQTWKISGSAPLNRYQTQRSLTNLGLPQPLAVWRKPE